MDTLRIATGVLPAAQRLEAFREIFGRKLLKIEIEPERGTEFDVDMTLQALPGLGTASGSLSPMRNRLTRELIDNDDLVFVILQEGVGTAGQLGRQATISNGQAILTANDEPGSFAGHTPTQLINLRFERKRLAPQLADADAFLLRPMSVNNPALRLLTSYLRIVGSELTRSSPILQRSAADHIHDLAALALGATRDAAETATGRGVRIARLHAIKADAVANAASSWLSLDAIAARHGLSPRYIRSLFQSEETTFTDFVLSQRLARAHALLVDPRYGDRLISAIAFEAGFGDLSYFNHRFRRRYGATPSDVRAAARRNDG
ncbi:AraC family transcriptional regulator [Bradyrhizobium sp. SSUT18]|uniref:AraC family transcriptional regulator n=1 Tax=unclassified Bradyrhizobium TaxID=2631580 RepID=UPI00244D01AF|nr:MULTISPECIES: AraC family transcriptional regulator [unclassified Bradyrhizobium]MDH2348944.1 AraC family transcriptional regulator [Bradyrhizobium sp. SSUT77]MDH2357027.1 AraC family transcriptional regulator [Bradyrhizobium sp. SSUT112]MDH2404947.1 AraC family transcriptional regulator [Bradyrhizobium sp. SSUT18]